MSFESLLQHTMDIARPTTAADSAGGQTVTYSTVASDVACLIRGASANEQARFAQQNMICSHVIAGRYASMQKGYRVTDADGNYYKVTGIRRQRGVGSIDDHYEYYCEQLK